MTQTTTMNARIGLPNSLQPLLDRFAIGAAVLCAIHCAVLPIVLALFPSLVSLPMDDHEFHATLVFVVFPLSVIASFMGCARHKDLRVILGVGLGLTLLVVAAVFGHDLLGETGEKAMTVAASIVLVAAHYRNFTLCRRKSCDDACC